MISAAAFAAYLQDLVGAAFGLLGLTTAIGWVRQRDRSLGFLALAIVLLSAVSIAGQIKQLLGLGSTVFGITATIAFLASGYALLRFRAVLVPMPRSWQTAALTLTSLAAALVVLSTLLGAAQTPLGYTAVLAALLVWCASVGEPILRFWQVSRRLAAVQRMRLRSLSLGFAAIVILILVSVAATRVVSTPTGRIATQSVALVIVALLYVSFSPPAWLRRAWRRPEEEAARGSIDAILLGSDNRAQLGDGILRWAIRLVGAEGGVLCDSGGAILASLNLSLEDIGEASYLAGRLPLQLTNVRVGDEPRMAIGVPIAMKEGSGGLVVLAGRFTPAFGPEELNRLGQYATAVGPALDRLSLIDQLQQANTQLAEASRHKSAFLANMSHELRTPLNAIIGFSELMIDDATGEFDVATRQTFIDQIHASGEHLLGLINDILDLSKIEAGQMELRSDKVVVQAVVDRVLNTVEALAAKKRIRLTAQASRAGTIIADPGKLTQMLLNLVANAIKFTPEDGRIRILARRQGGSLEISVKDTGIGIAEADQERVFRQFEQAGGGTSGKEQGTGLGLTLTRRFAELHGGTLRLQSKLGEGSVFTLTLPFAPPDSMPAASPESILPRVSVDSGAPLILVVEDNPQAAELLIRNLSRGGYRTIQARDGVDAVAKARDLKPAAITLDILLPDVDGWTVLGLLKQDEATSRIPVIVVSVVDDPELGLALGAIDYLVKPVDPKELLESVGRYSHGGAGKDARTSLLVVDDEEANRTWVRSLLEPAGYGVTLAASGEEALELLKAEQPDLVVLDLMMPGMTGFELLDAIRADARTRSLPILVLTSKDLTSEERRELNGKVAAVLSRTSDPTDLLNLLDTLVSQGSALAAS